jgi:hypothetical protein
VLSAHLTQLLKKSDAEERRSDDAGIDFDPILNSQDPGDRYEARRITLRGGRCFAEAYSHYSEARREDFSKPDVVAELAPQDRKWQFVNFHYPNAEYPASENMISSSQITSRLRIADGEMLSAHDGLLAFRLHAA